MRWNVSHFIRRDVFTFRKVWSAGDKIHFASSFLVFTKKLYILNFLLCLKLVSTRVMVERKVVQCLSSSFCGIIWHALKMLTCSSTKIYSHKERYVTQFHFKVRILFIMFRQKALNNVRVTPLLGPKLSVFLQNCYWVITSLVRNIFLSS